MKVSPRKRNQLRRQASPHVTGSNAMPLAASRTVHPILNLQRHDPDGYRPTEGWEFSPEAYNLAALISFHFLKMRLTTEDGTPVEPRNIFTRANHDVGLPVELRPAGELRIPVPLHEFYDLKSGLNYSLELVYGDDNLRVHAKTQFQYP